jgi:hypothetical protein
MGCRDCFRFVGNPEVIGNLAAVIYKCAPKKHLFVGSLGATMLAPDNEELAKAKTERFLGKPWNSGILSVIAIYRQLTSCCADARVK